MDYYREHTSAEFGKSLHEFHIEPFKRGGKDSVIRLIESGCSTYEKEEGLCDFYIDSFGNYVDDLEEVEEEVEVLEV